MSSSVQGAKDAIDEMPNVGDMDDPQMIHDHVVTWPEILDSVQEKCLRISEDIPGTGVKDSYADAYAEAAASLSGIADQLRNVVGGGVPSSSGG